MRCCGASGRAARRPRGGCLRRTEVRLARGPPCSGIARRYTEDHEWVQPLGTGRARIGITDYAQNALGDFVYVELPKVGAQVAKKDSIGVVESVKGASDIYAPVSGTITAVNEAAAAKPSLVNKSPEKDGSSPPLPSPTTTRRLAVRDGPQRAQGGRPSLRRGRLRELLQGHRIATQTRLFALLMKCTLPRAAPRASASASAPHQAA